MPNVDSAFQDILGTVGVWTMIDTFTDICTSESWPSNSHLWLDFSRIPSVALISLRVSSHCRAEAFL